MVDVRDLKSREDLNPRESSSLSPGTDIVEGMDFPYGKLLSSMPDDFVPPDLWPEYCRIADPPSICKREVLGDKPGNGERWGVWPLFFELYTGDVEPDVYKEAQMGQLRYNRIVTWHRLRTKDQPPGWYTISKNPRQVDGFIDLKQEIPHITLWNKKARRDLRRWQTLSPSKYTIERVSLTEYGEAYKKSWTGQKIGFDRLYQVEERFKLGVGEHIELWAVLNTKGEIIAGNAILFSPTYLHSANLAPFTNEEGKKVYGMTALIDYWFNESKKRGYQYAVTTNFWFPGQPRGWKGFSEFKSHFGFSYVPHPPELFRFMRGKVF